MPALIAFLAALTDLVDQGDTDLTSKFGCVAAGLGSTNMSDEGELGCVGTGL